MKFTFVLAFFLSVFASYAMAQGSNAATYRLEGDASLMSNYIESGLTHSNSDPALQGSFWFNFGPQFRMGLWGSNVSFKNSSSHFLLKINADLKVEFTPDSFMVLSYSNNRYFKSDDRDGSTLGLKLDFYGYGIHYISHSNFFGTEEKATGFAFSKAWPVFQTWNWENLLGYMTLNSPALSNYFYLESFLGTRAGSIDWQIGASYNSSSSQFNEAGKPALILRGIVRF